MIALTRFILIAISLWLLSACYPRVMGQRPGIKSQVVDKATRQPIAHASIQTFNGKTYFSDAQGYFSIDPEKVMGLATPMGGSVTIHASFKVSKAGYDSANCFCDALSNAPWCRSGLVQLSRPGAKLAYRRVREDAGYGEIQCLAIPPIAAPALRD